MKTRLEPEEKLLIIPEIKAVLDGADTWEAPQLHFPVEAITNAILEIPGVKKAELEDPTYGIDGFDTNGWQWDWWQTFEYSGQRFVLSGSGYYGGHSFALED